LRFNKLFALSLTALIALTGCAAELETTEQDSIVVYAGRDEELVQPLIERFEEETGIQVEVRYASSAELAAQLLEEGDNSPADVFFAQDAGALGAVSKAGLLTKLPQEIYGLVPTAYSAADGMWVGVSGRVRVLNYNPNTVTELPKSVFDLADPIWKGRVAIAPSNASFQAFVTAMRVVEGDEKTLQWLTAMKQNAVIFEKNGAILEAVEAGQVDLGLINHYYWYALAQEQGVENMKSKIAQFETNDVGNLINAAGVGIVNDSTAARKFVEYLLSETGQTYFAESTREYPLVAGVVPADDLTPLKDIPAPKVDLSDLDSLERTLELIRQAGLI
jgi:iron(III) transport system substrate-binding protein